MANEKRSEAKRLFLEEQLPLTEIAARLDVGSGTIRQWKRRDGWENVTEALQTVTQERDTVKTRKRATDNNKQIIQTINNCEEITDKEKDFCLYFVSSYNAVQSAIKAGYKGSYLTIKNTAYEVLHRPAVHAMIDALKTMKRLSILASVDDVLEMHMRIAFSDIGDYVNFGQREQQVMTAFGPLCLKNDLDEDVPVMKTVNFIDLNEKSLVDTVMLAEISQGQNGVKIKLQDRQKSLDFLERYFLINPLDQHRIDYDNKKYELDKNKAEAETKSLAAGSVIIPDAVWRGLMNDVYADHLISQQTTQVFFGGSSSGKSFAILGQRTVRDVMTGKRNYLIVRKTGRTLRNSSFNEVWKCISRMDLEGEFNRNKTDMVITHKASGCQILFCGLDDVEKVKSITPQVGVITDIVIEEATETEYNDYKSLKKRLRGGDESIIKRMVLLFNPILQDHWIYTEFFAGKWDDTKNYYADAKLLILRTTYKDNRWLTADDITKLEDETDKYYYDVYTLGKWGVLGNLIFTNWETKDLAEIAKATNRFYNGLDFGFYPDPAAYVRMGYNRAKKEVYIFRELGGTDMTNDVLAELLKPVIRKETLTCDSAEPKSIQELNNFGLNAIPVVKGPGSVEFSIKWLQRQKIYIDPRCIATIMEFKKYKYKEDRNGRVLPEPVDRDNHYIDSARYGLMDVMVETKVV